VGLAALAAAALCAVAPACAGSLKVRDADGSQWRVVEDPADDAQGYLLQRLGRDGKPDPRFGHGGQRPVSISATNDAPTSVRVDGDYRVWVAGAAIAGDQPQAVVERFLPDGAVDLHWGVQGKVQLSPGGLAIKPNDLLPLADGSVLVAGVAANLEPTRAVVFHLKSDGSLDTAFGTGGTWQRAGASDGSTATSLGAGSDGSVAVSVAARGTNAAGEIWSLDGGPAKRVRQRPLDDSSDGEDLRVAWAGDHWAFDTAGGPTSLVAPALLGAHPRAANAVGVAASDPGQGAFSPFAAEPASAAPEPSPEPVDGGLPWRWIAIVAALCVAPVGVLLARGRGPRTVLKAGPRR
jgi:hypothetical protein